MAERLHNKPRLSNIPNNDERPSQLLSFTFLFERSLTKNSNTGQTEKKKDFHLQSNEIKFFHSGRSVWFRRLMKMSIFFGLILI